MTYISLQLAVLLYMFYLIVRRDYMGLIVLCTILQVFFLLLLSAYKLLFRSVW